jgi:hypothetical protein
MSTIQVFVVNDTGLSQDFAVFDMNAADPTTPIFEDVLDPDQKVGPLFVETGTDVLGQIRWVSEQSGQSTVDVPDGQIVMMSVTG